MKRPRKALVLAAGFGTRLRPLTDAVPKPLLPLWNAPMIDHVLALLADWGVRDALVNLHYRAGALLDHLRARRAAPRISLSFEPAILGTGGALARAQWFFDGAPFWVINADVAADLSPRPFLDGMQCGAPLAVLWMHPRRGPRTVDVRDGTVRCFHSARPGTPGTFTFCGLQLVAPALFDYLAADGAFQTLVDAYRRGMAAGRRVAAVAPETVFWRDVGTPAGYIEAHAAVLAAARQGRPGARLMAADDAAQQAALRRRGVRIDGFACVARGAAVAPGARLRHAVILAGATVGGQADVCEAVIGPGARVAGSATGLLTRADDAALDRVLQRTMDAMGYPAARTMLETLPARGSARSFTRLVCGRSSCILIRYSMQRRENARFARHARFLAGQGVPAPRVLLDLPREHAAAIEDLGDRRLDRAIRRGGWRVAAPLYRRAFDAMLKLHAVPERAVRAARLRLEPRFGRDLYAWERNLFGEHLLRGYLGLRPARVRRVLADLETVAERLLDAPPVLVHRDLQSSNILLRHGAAFLIDFQGMRWGPAAYDVASLLCDPYVMMPPELQERLFEEYRRRAPDAAASADTFAAAAVERLAQALGAFGRLCAQPGTRRFEGHIPDAVRMMARMLDQLGGLPHLREVIEDMMVRQDHSGEKTRE